MRCHPAVTAAGGTPAVLPMATGGQAGATNSLPWVKRKSEQENGMKCKAASLEMNQANLGSLFFVKNTVTPGDKSAELASFGYHFPARHLGII